jgi:protein-tyrosine phosphatase
VGFLSRIFGQEEKPGEVDTRLQVDLHSHLLVGIDDGVQTPEESADIIRTLKDSGVKKIITTPHIQSDYFKNTPEIISAKLAELKTWLQGNGISIDIEAAAEYYIDEGFEEKFLKKQEALLTFGKKYLLVETSYLQKPYNLEQVLFDLKIAGYKPVLAHPERYNFLIDDFRKMNALFDTGVYFQLNLLSLANMYSPQTKKAAEYMIKNKMVHFVGSDIHNIRHARTLYELKRSKAYAQLMELPIMNNSLL